MSTWARVGLGWLTAAAAVVATAVAGVTTGGGADAATPAGFTVGVGSDHGSGPAAAEVLRAVGADRPDFFLSAGDLGLGDITEAAWCQLVKDNLNAGAGLPAGDAFGETYPFEITVGNHDATTVQNYVTSTCLPDRLGAVPAAGGSYGRQYYLDYPASAPLARFIVTDPGISAPYSAGSARLAWVGDTIDQARAAGIPWVIAVNHEDYITAGVKTDEIGSDFFNLLVSKRVDLIVEGHDHTYQRSKQLAQGPGCPLVTTGTANPACVADDGSDGEYRAGDGPVLLISATGGQGAYDINPADPELRYFAVTNGAANYTRGFTRLSVTPDALTARFVRSGGGDLADAFEIARAPDTSPPTAPATLTGQATSSSRVDLAWSAATDDRGVARYQLLRDGVVLPGGTAGLSTSATGLAAATTYRFTVRAVDFAGNVGPPSPEAVVTTLPSDATVFAEHWTGPDGSAWPVSAWATDAAQGSVDVAGNTGRLQFTDRSGAWARAALIGVRTVTDTDLVLSYQWDSTTSLAYFNVHVRGSGGWQNAYRPRTGYGVQFSSNSATAVLTRNVNGTLTTLRSVGGGQSVTTARQWLRLQAVGSTVRFRTWLDGQPEPQSWTASVTDTGIAGAGQVFVSLNRSSANTGAKAVRLDDLQLVDASTPTPDTQPPSSPAALRATAISASSVTLAWDTATDDIGVAGYRVARDGVAVATLGPGELTFTDTGLSPATSYRYDVVAVDAVPNVSAPATLTVTTAATSPVLDSESWTGADGARWPTTWTTTGTADIRSGAGRLSVGDATQASARGALTGVAAVADCDLVLRYRWSSAGARAYLSLFVRGSGGWQNAYRPMSGYGVQLQSDSSTAVIQRNVGGVLTNLRSVSGAQVVGTGVQWLRLRVTGSSVQLRTWRDGQPEPAGWTASLTDTAVAAAGQVYVSLNRSSTNVGQKDVLLDDLVLTRAA